MTAEIPDAARTALGNFEIPPRTDTRIPGTPFVVRCDVGSVSTVRVLGDGAIELGRARGWIVRTT